jgi:hypothetical protein
MIASAATAGSVKTDVISKACPIIVMSCFPMMPKKHEGKVMQICVSRAKVLPAGAGLYRQDIGGGSDGTV